MTCIQISQEAGKVVWYSHLFKNFPQIVVITEWLYWESKKVSLSCSLCELPLPEYPWWEHSLQQLCFSTWMPVPLGGAAGATALGSHLFCSLTRLEFHKSKV